MLQCKLSNWSVVAHVSINIDNEKLEKKILHIRSLRSMEVQIVGERFSFFAPHSCK